ncbi:MAG: alpha/beta hydrolase [Chloroflexi bacterium]|nr:alpha/beta hydrolase [Chloroflexota bacterium]
MNKVTIICAIVCAVLFLNLPATHAQEGGQYASVNGLEIYYEVHGEGQPLMLLHGGLGGTVEFAQLIPALAESRQVIAVELQGHGHTADIDRLLTYEGMADDIAALIEHLEYDSVDILGFSLGGGVALQTAIRHPEVVRKLVVISAPYSQSGIHPEFLGGMMAMNAEAAAAMIETPMYQYYASVAPNLDDWPTLVGKLGEMLSQDYDWSEDVATIAAPTLIVAGDSDEIPPTHAASMFELLGGGVPGDFVGLPNSQLAILPGTTHFTILTRTDLLVPIVTAFLDAPLPEAE